jgi:nucleoside-diphosphate-sugar epimerase
MRVIVLGATGQIGSVIYNGLMHTHEVVGTSRKASHNYLPFDPFKGNWSDLGKTDVLINCVGQIQASDASSFHHIHVELTKRIITNRQQIGNPALIQISALGASATHKVEFLRTKGIADDLLLQHPDTVVIRPSIVCTHQTMIVKKLIMLSNLSRWLFGVIPVPKGFLKTRIQPVMPQDFVDIVKKKCFDRSIRIVHAVGPEALSFQEIIAFMMESRHQKLRTIDVSKRLSDTIMLNLVSRVFPNVVNSQQYQLLFEDNVADPRIAQQMLARPLLSVRQFFKNEFAYATH